MRALGLDLEEVQEEDMDADVAMHEEDTDSDEEVDMEGDMSEGARERWAEPSAPPQPIASCSYLHPGRTFKGTQRLSGMHRPQEDWEVTATIISCCMRTGAITGSMVARNGPTTKRPVVTYFEGDIIDSLNHTFWTGSKWGAHTGPDTDLRHWARCPGFTPALRRAVVVGDGRAGAAGAAAAGAGAAEAGAAATGRGAGSGGGGGGGGGGGFIFMRWKECFFVDVPQDCPLTISGFYYLSLERATGAIRGSYYDARSSPLQVLQLQPAELWQPDAVPEDSGGGAGTSSSGGGGSTLSPRGSRPQAPGGQAQGRAASDGPDRPCGLTFPTYTLC